MEGTFVVLCSGTRPPYPKDSASTTPDILRQVLVDAGYEERYWYPDDGGEVWVAGYQLVDPESGRYLARDAPELTARGLHVAGVAGAGAHHAEALAERRGGSGQAARAAPRPRQPA